MASIEHVGPTVPPNEPDDGSGVFRLVFVGTGVSTCIPVIGHIDSDCACKDALKNPCGPNHRNNVSMLIQRGTSNVLIDVGKTFREAYFRTMLPRGIARLDAVLITHDHADAMLGIDDLRDFETFRHEGLQWVCETPIPVYLSQRTLDTLSQGFGYITKTSIHAGTADNADVLPVQEALLERRVACLRLRTVDDEHVRKIIFEPGILTGLPFYSVPVFHGGTYRCLGFAFGEGCYIPEDASGPVPDRATAAASAAGPCVLYLSDVSKVPVDVMQLLLRMSPIDVLVIDMLLADEDHYSHLSINGAWELILLLQPRRAYGVGMYCSIEHHDTNARLQRRLDAYRRKATTRIELVELAFDGKELPLR